MNEKEELEKELIEKLHWIQYRQKMLDIIEEKLLRMKELAYTAKEGNLASKELQEVNAKLKLLESQVRALDEESKRIEDEKIL